MKERIFKNWKTTLTGILMLAGGLALVGMGKGNPDRIRGICPGLLCLDFCQRPIL